MSNNSVYITHGALADVQMPDVSSVLEIRNPAGGLMFAVYSDGSIKGDDPAGAGAMFAEHFVKSLGFRASDRY